MVPGLNFRGDGRFQLQHRYIIDVDKCEPEDKRKREASKDRKRAKMVKAKSNG